MSYDPTLLGISVPRDLTPYILTERALDVATDATRIRDHALRSDVFATRLRHELQRETHVIVGDHPPEPRLKPPTRGPDGTFHNPTDDPDICDADGLPVAQCGGAACRSHKRCCWQ